MIAALLNRSFHLDERACNETGKQRDMFLSFALFIINRVVSQSLSAINNAHMYMRGPVVDSRCLRGRAKIEKGTRVQKVVMHL